jgi:hypothetical protein
MKKKMKICVIENFSPSPEEYRLFRCQGEQVLACYALAKGCMAILMPLSAAAAVYHPVIALGFSIAAGLTGFLLLHRKYGVKGALLPLCCSLAGFLTGLFILSPLFSHVRALKEGYDGL